MPPNKPLHLGIIGCSAEGAALCYRTFCVEGEALLGAHQHPEVSMHSHSLRDYVECIERNDWAAVADLMRSSAEKLKLAGAQFLICPDNTIHQALERLEVPLPLPFLHIAAVVAEEAKRRGFRRIAITGTRWLISSDVYLSHLSGRGLTGVRPSLAEREDINQIIMEELVKGRFLRASIDYLRQVIGRMGKEEYCDSVVLGCTELPLVLSDANSPLPTLDSTRLLARAALRHAVDAQPSG